MTTVVGFLRSPAWFHNRDLTCVVPFALAKELICPRITTVKSENEEMFSKSK